VNALRSVALALFALALPATGYHLARSAHAATSPAVAIPTGAPRPKPLRGWDAAYDEHIRREVARAPALLDLGAARMEKICPRWASMDRDQRTRFYADLLFSIAWPESRHDRRVIAQEPGIIDPATGRQQIDAVTGQPIVSEGLLQLSYADKLSYPPQGGLACEFDWPRDREAFLADLAAHVGKRSFKSGHPERTILEPYVQFTCAIHVLSTLVRKHSDREFRAAAGAYWSTMRPHKPLHQEVVGALKRRRSACFGT
jgi:hypothetical protein